MKIQRTQSSLQALSFNEGHTRFVPVKYQSVKMTSWFKIFNNKIDYILILVLVNYFHVNRIITQLLDLLPSDSKTAGGVSQYYLWVEYYLLCKRKNSVVSTSALQVHKGFKDTINPSQLFIFNNVILRCSLPLWVDYFFYFKFTCVILIVYQSLHLYFN